MVQNASGTAGTEKNNNRKMNVTHLYREINRKIQNTKKKKKKTFCEMPPISKTERFLED